MLGWNRSRSLIRRHAKRSCGVDRGRDVIIVSAIQHQVVDARCANDGNGIDLLTDAACGILLRGVLRLAAIQTITDRIVLGTRRRSAGVPGEGDFVMSGR